MTGQSDLILSVDEVEIVNRERNAVFGIERHIDRHLERWKVIGFLEGDIHLLDAFFLDL